MEAAEEAAEETLRETPSLTQGTSIMSTSNTGTDEVLISREGKRKRKAYLPTKPVKIIRDWRHLSIYTGQVRAQRSRKDAMPAPVPLPAAQESGENLLNPESAPGQNFTRKAQPEEKDKIFTSRALFVSSPKPVATEEYADFSNFQLLVDVAVQKAAELELLKNRETNP